jgi:hypothetical protein
MWKICQNKHSYISEALYSKWGRRRRRRRRRRRKKNEATKWNFEVMKT